MYELFYAEPTAAMGTRVVLEEIGRIGIINGHSGTESKYPIEAPPSLGRSSRTSAGQASL